MKRWKLRDLEYFGLVVDHLGRYAGVVIYDDERHQWLAPLIADDSSNLRQAIRNTVAAHLDPPCTCTGCHLDRAGTHQHKGGGGTR